VPGHGGTRGEARPAQRSNVCASKRRLASPIGRTCPSGDSHGGAPGVLGCRIARQAHRQLSRGRPIAPRCAIMGAACAEQQGARRASTQGAMAARQVCEHARPAGARPTSTMLGALATLLGEVARSACRSCASSPPPPAAPCAPAKSGRKLKPSGDEAVHASLHHSPRTSRLAPRTSHLAASCIIRLAAAWRRVLPCSVASPPTRRRGQARQLSRKQPGTHTGALGGAHTLGHWAGGGRGGARTKGSLAGFPGLVGQRHEVLIEDGRRWVVFCGTHRAPHNKRAATRGQQQEGSNKRAATRGQQQEGSNKSAATRGQQQEGSNKRAATRAQQQEGSNKRAATRGQQQEGSNKRAATRGQQQERSNKSAATRAQQQERSNKRHVRRRPTCHTPTTLLPRSPAPLPCPTPLSNTQGPE